MVVTSPDLLFVGYGESVSKARLGQMFGIDIAPVYDELRGLSLNVMAKA